MSYVNCQLCPRACRVDRTIGQLGFCRCPDGVELEIDLSELV